MDAHVAMTFLKTTVFTHKVQIIATNDNSTLHFSFAHNAGKDAATDSHITSPGALFVNVGAIDGLQEEAKLIR